MSLIHDTRTPDVETASTGYASRFSGPAGRFLLDVQRRLVLNLLSARARGSLRILDVGGGHGQLTPGLLDAGHNVVVQGSSQACAGQLRSLLARFPNRLSFVTSDLWALPFGDRSFDAVIALRLLAHVERYRELLAEMARVSRDRLILDFPPRLSVNLLEPWMFTVKRRLEGNTRPFFCYRQRQLDQALEAAGFRRTKIEKQFFLPMVVHRVAKAPGVSATLEQISRDLGLTARLGAPCLLAAERLEPQP